VHGSDLRRREETLLDDSADEVVRFGYAGDPDGTKEVLEPLTIRERTRSWVTKFLLVTITSAMLVATGIGLWTGDWKYVNVVWTVAAVIVGFIVRFYFRRKNE